MISAESIPLPWTPHRIKDAEEIIGNRVKSYEILRSEEIVRNHRKSNEIKVECWSIRISADFGGFRQSPPLDPTRIKETQ